MYLKNIEIQGFKSFANKMTFEFHNGITAIVGPNGSGKSNVADAVRWVLGEQKVRQLRGNKMEDVIFSGTETRKPLGFAYVSITLDNSDHQLQIDFEEVKVSRRIFRSGESEYKINGSTCRLKDISELFYDTGIGKEGYSIIGQGQIEKILSEKPEDRRELFDEAAGIVKFKRRKAVSIKKLEDERVNLVRVRDILSELNSQLDPLKRQSETARIYLKLKEQVKSVDLQIFLKEASDIQNKKNQIKEKSEIIQNNIQEAKSTYEFSRIEFDEASSLSDLLTEKIEQKTQKYNEIKLFREKAEGEINVIREKINSLQTNDQQIKERLDGFCQKELLLNNQKTDFLNQKKELDSRLLDMSAKLEKEEEELKKIQSIIEDHSSLADSLNGDIICNLNEKSNVGSRIQRFDAMLEQIQVRENGLSSHLEKIGESLQDAEHFYTKIQSEFEQEELNLKKSRKEYEDFQVEFGCHKEKMDEIRAELHDVQNTYHRENSRLESLRNIVERYDGYGNSIQKIMELRSVTKGIAGVVADLIHTDKKYETAIETALGGNLRNIVTDTEKTAKFLIDHLKKNKYGRATFLPLESILSKTDVSGEKLSQETGFVGIASNLVNTEEKYVNITKFLLGKVIIVDSIDNALKIASKYRYSLRIVTLEGEQLNPGGSISGGAHKNSGNLLSRKRELEELSHRVDLLNVRSKELSEKYENSVKVYSEMEKELELRKDTIQKCLISLNRSEVNLGQHKDKIFELKNLRSTSEAEMKELKNQIKDILSQKELLMSELELIENKNNEIRKKIDSKITELESFRSEHVFQIESNEKLRLAIATLKQEKEFLLTNIRRIESEIHNLQEEIQIIINNHSKSEQELHFNLERIDELKSMCQNYENEAGTLCIEIEEIENSKKALLQKNRGFLEKRDALSNEINELEKELLRIETQLERIQESYDSRVEYIWNEYELTYNEVRQMEIENINIAKTKKELETYRSAIRKLGDVNVNSIEEYKTVSERYEFLKRQYDDLAEAEETLVKIIHELDKGMRNQFMDQFKLIQEEFGKVFRDLFGGGYANLEMVQEEDILDAGIIITAQPPGKKLQNVQLMSGGEKALTAISLLFAIQNLKPSPFCMLDEIEAALDDSNIGRFAQYLNQLCINTQFIVITHRKGTMACADRLYGITMQEKGISTQVSVNLEEFQLVT